MNRTKQRERRAIAEPLVLQGKPLFALYATITLLWKHLSIPSASRVVIQATLKIHSSRHLMRSLQSYLLKQPVIRKIDSQKQATGLEGLPIPLVTIKTGLKTPDGHEEILSEYLCDYPGCPQIATRMLGCVVELGAIAVVCEEHAGQKSR
jgi:hypothetical protein